MPIIEARSLRKAYGGTKALDGVDFTLEAGSVHALLGENGAGKSTLVKILAGAIRSDSGEMRLDDSARNFTGTQQAQAAGIAWVAQELTLFPDLSILDNLFPNVGPKRGIFSDRKTREALAQPVLDSLHLNHTTSTPVSELTLAERQLVEISRALIQKPKVLILDEPTSALEQGSSDRLIAILKVLRDSGVGVFFVSHILQEVIDLCDTVTVLRDGKNAITAEPISQHSVDSIVAAMVGEKKIHARTGRRQLTATSATRGALIFDGVTTPSTLKNVSIRVRPGEVVGVAGLVGSGHEEVLKVAVGQIPAIHGSITLPDGSPQPKNLVHSAHRGVAFVSGDRKRFGLMLDKSIATNVAVVRDFALTKDGWIMNYKRARENALKFIKQIAIRTPSPELLAGSLSGGNQQKVVFAKWLNASPSLLLLDDPTRGVDVGAKGEMHKIIEELSHSLIPTLINSTDLEELANVCDRVYVFKNGEITHELQREELSISRLLVAMN
jgi:ABC-type sugar transport system ATPase subunit